MNENRTDLLLSQDIYIKKKVSVELIRKLYTGALTCVREQETAWHDASAIPNTHAHSNHVIDVTFRQILLSLQFSDSDSNVPQNGHFLDIFPIDNVRVIFRPLNQKKSVLIWTLHKLIQANINTTINGKRKKIEDIKLKRIISIKFN